MVEWLGRLPLTPKTWVRSRVVQACMRKIFSKIFSQVPDPWVGRIKRLVFSDKDEKLGGPVCTLRTLKTPWQLKIEGRVGDICRLPGQNSKFKSHPKLATLSQSNIKEYLRNRNEAAREARGTTIP